MAERPAGRSQKRPPDPARRRVRPPTRGAGTTKGWDEQAKWYDGWVGSKGSAYHQRLAIPLAMELLDLRRGEAVIDVGGGQGVLASAVVEAGASYTCVDVSPRMVSTGRKRHGRVGRFLVGDARHLAQVPGLKPSSFDAAVLLLSAQDMNPLEPVFESLAWALVPSGRVVMVMTHPAFRQPRHAGWGYDADRKLTYRRVDAYLTPMQVPMKAIPGKRATTSFHRPLETYVTALVEAGFVIDALREPPDLPPDVRPGRKPARGSAEVEIPLLLALRARRSAGRER